MSTKYDLAGAAKYLAGDGQPIPPRRMRALAKLIRHARISKRAWLFEQRDLDDFIERHRHEPLTVFPAVKKSQKPRNESIET
jgi:hypothetical protein